MTLSVASFPSPNSALSAMYLNLEKLILAPLTTATNVRCAPKRRWVVMYFFIPATERAPEGSGTERVSFVGRERGVSSGMRTGERRRNYEEEEEQQKNSPSKTSLIAAHNSSFETQTISSTYCAQSLKLSSPICLTAVPSANSPT